MTMPVRAPAPGAVPEFTVNVAEFVVVRGKGIIATCGLGSCVAVALYDARSRTAGLAHVLLPDNESSRTRDRPAKFATTAVPLLLEAMRRSGSVGGTVAKIVGGASMFGTLLSSGGVNMGERNTEAVRRALAAAEVPLLAEDVGGDHGRSVYFDVSSGLVRVHSLARGERWL
jgi:chemotaxis protein CheD